LILSNGVVQVDKLVMTNSCGQFIHTGGTLIIGSVVLNPNAPQITSLAPQGNNLNISWISWARAKPTPCRPRRAQRMAATAQMGSPTFSS
jgi:hypothetical protein